MIRRLLWRTAPVGSVLAFGAGLGFALVGNPMGAVGSIVLGTAWAVAL